MDRIPTKFKCKIVLIPDGPNSVSKFYLQVADKKLTTTVFPLLFREARASGLILTLIANSKLTQWPESRALVEKNRRTPLHFDICRGAVDCVFKTVISTIN